MSGSAYHYAGSNPEVSHQYLYPIISNFLKDVPAGATVIDAGCGNGSFISNFKDRKWKLHGFDVSPTGIEIARRTFPDIDFFLVDREARYADFRARVGEADIVISTEVIEHLYDPRGFLRNCYELLRRGGVAIFTTPYHGYLKNLMLAVTGKMNQHFTVLWDHGHIKFWSRETFEQALRETGFRDIEFAGAGRVPFLWKSMVLKARKPD